MYLTFIDGIQDLNTERKNPKDQFVVLNFKRLASTVFVLFVWLPMYKASAVGGISNSKVIVPSAETVPFKQYEIEPFFGLVITDDNENTIGFEGGGRFTIGVFNNMEVGANVGFLTIDDSDVIDTEANFGNIGFGMKYRFIDQGDDFPFFLAYQGGFTVPTGTSDDQWIFEPFGLILTKNFTEYFSTDADIVLALVENESIGFVADIGFGYFVRPWLQPVIEAGFSFEDPEDRDSISVLNVTAGFTSPVNEMLTIIIGVTPDVYTRNKDNEILISAAFTFLF